LLRASLELKIIMERAKRVVRYFNITEIYYTMHDMLN